MKIMSYIQKTIYALFLLALFSGCTDEVLDGGGNGSTPPIEEGKLVDVKFVLDKAGAKTVMTRSDKDSDEPEVDDELLFLQYKDGKLVYAWYTEEEEDVFDVQDSKDEDKDEIEGWGARGTVMIRLLSGEGYHVYVIANLDLSKSYYEQTSFTKGDDNERGPVYINKESFKTEFGTEDALLSWRRNSSSFVENDDRYDAAFEYDKDDKDGIDLDDDPVMFAVASNESMGVTPVYRYTKMATNLKVDGARVNDMIDFTKGVPSVSIYEGSSICATLYQPYAKVALKIEAENLMTSVTIKSVEVLNCPLDYSLVNGFNLASDETGTTKYTLGFGEKDIFEGKTLSKSAVLNEDFEDYVYIFENMAGVVNSNGSNQQDKVPADFDPHASNNSDAYDNAAKDYTYIKVTGECDGEPITYRFILGSDSKTNCNLERNVFYKVTMRLTGNAGVNEATWRVEYEGKENIPNTPPDDPIVVSPSEIDLDAHATLNKINVTFNEEGHYYIFPWTGEGEPTSYNTDNTLSQIQSMGCILAGTLKNTATGEDLNIDWSTPGTGTQTGRGHITVSEGQEGTYELSFIKVSWFDNAKGVGHTADQPDAIARANPETYKFYIAYCKDAVLTTSPIIKSNKMASFTITQYPPLVMGQYRDGSFVFNGDFWLIERFVEDDDGKKNTSQLLSEFDEKHSATEPMYPSKNNWEDLSTRTVPYEQFQAADDKKNFFYIFNGVYWNIPFDAEKEGFNSDLPAHPCRDPEGKIYTRYYFK